MSKDNKLETLERTNMTKRVSFAANPHETIAYQEDLTVEERNKICWYDNEELLSSRFDAKRAIQIFLLMSRGSVLVRSNKDKHQISFRGVEKYGNPQICELKKSKLLIRSVLLRQMEHPRRVKQGRTVCLKEELADVSKRLSAPCIKFAHFHAVKSFQQAGDGDENDYCPVPRFEPAKGRRLADERTDCAKRRRVSLSPYQSSNQSLRSCYAFPHLNFTRCDRTNACR